MLVVVITWFRLRRIVRWGTIFVWRNMMVLFRRERLTLLRRRMRRVFRRWLIWRIVPIIMMVVVVIIWGRGMIVIIIIWWCSRGRGFRGCNNIILFSSGTWRCSIRIVPESPV